MLAAREAAAAAAAEGGQGEGGGGCTFVVNVSAMEGKFYRFKTADHPHTNMAKAALNMMTRYPPRHQAPVAAV